MIKSLGWATLEQRKLLDQASTFYKIYIGFIDMNFPLEVFPIMKLSRLPNCQLFHQISVFNIYKYSFHPRTIVTWNNLPLVAIPTSISEFKIIAIPAIRTFV